MIIGKARGSYGSLNFDLNTGHVLSIDYDDTRDNDYNDIVRIDVKEHFKFYAKRYTDPKSVTEFDILDLAFWAKDGDYVPADKGYRDLNLS